VPNLTDIVYDKSRGIGIYAIQSKQGKKKKEERKEEVGKERKKVERVRGCNRFRNQREEWKEKIKKR
jgi:hypothetical protein